MDVGNLANELRGCGCAIRGVDSNGNISWADTSNQKLADLVIAAHEKVLASAECVVLRDYLGGDKSSEWTAYLEARNQPVAAERAQRYVAETDSLFMKAWELLDGAERDTALAAWRAAKDAIRKELPYPE